jgi:hypothetical protein
VHSPAGGQRMNLGIAGVAPIGTGPPVTVSVTLAAGVSAVRFI